MKTKPSGQLTVRDRLSHLNYTQACKMLGADGKKLLSLGAKYEFDNLERSVLLQGDLFRLRFPRDCANEEPVIVTMTMMASAQDRLHYNCNRCDSACEHIAAALSLVLEEKMLLGLAEAPAERVPIESLGEEELIQRALDERQNRAEQERFRLKSSEPDVPWTDYVITSAASGKTYRVALRGEQRGASYCSCPDFRSNTLGTCKHIMYALNRARQKFKKQQRNRKYRNRDVFVHLQYGVDLSLHLRLPDKPSEDLVRLAGKLADKPVTDVRKLIRTIDRLERAGFEPIVYPDAEEYIQRRLMQSKLSERAAEIRREPESHPLRNQLLKTELLPYQLDGIAFAASAGRAILADDMGLGKTIQGIGLAELLAREAGIGRVLVVCPASVKSQWKSEIRRFSDRDAQIVVGSAEDRVTQYRTDRFFTICNYEQVLRDVLTIESVPWDLIILDEGQRIKNWESKTAGVIKSLKSIFALVLSGTPLENRLDDLYSVAQFVDDRRLGPAFRFFNRHRMVDEKGKVLGYRKLDELRKTLQPIMLRRTRGDVLQQLPPRSTEIVRIPPTEEQYELHQSHLRVVSSITNKSYFSEMDLLRLRKALMMCRMSANSTFLVDKEPPGYSSKLDRLTELIDELSGEADRKTVLFSEWTTMLNLIEPVLKERQIDYVRLDGSVPQKKRQTLVGRFQNDENCRLFLATNAGATGLNLQAADTIINVDLPWNPALLEQRIARAHRMGQQRPVQIYLLVTEQTLEERLLATLSAKNDLSLAVLDSESEVDRVDMISGVEEMRRRLEVLLGAAPDAPVDESTKPSAAAESAPADREHRERIAAAGGKLLGAAFEFLGQLVSQKNSSEPSEQVVADLRDRLTDCVEEDSATGQSRLTVTLPDQAALDNFALTMARLMAAGNGNC